MKWKIRHLLIFFILFVLKIHILSLNANLSSIILYSGIISSSGFDNKVYDSNYTGFNGDFAEKWMRIETGDRRLLLVISQITEEGYIQKEQYWPIQSNSSSISTFAGDVFFIFDTFEEAENFNSMGIILEKNEENANLTSNLISTSESKRQVAGNVIINTLIVYYIGFLFIVFGFGIFWLRKR